MRWLHRIGYITTALILAETALIGYLLTRRWLRERQITASIIEDRRTHETPLLRTDDPWVRGRAIELLKTLPPLSSLHGNGVRFVAMPSFGINHYAIAISLAPNASQAQGILKSFNLQAEGTANQRTFAMPAAAYRSLVGSMDRMTDGWPGDSELCVDGSPMAFERVRGERTTSGIGNCSEHYDKLELLMLNYIRRFAPGNDLPTKNDWHRMQAKTPDVSNRPQAGLSNAPH